MAGGCRSKALHAAEANELCCYAGSLLRLPDQRPLGTRCLIDRHPRTFTVLMRDLFTGHGVQILVPAELLAQVKRRLLYLQDGLTKRQC